MSLVSDRVSRLRPATKADLHALADKVVYMGCNWGLYLPVWVLETLFTIFGSSITHVVTIPEVEAGAIYIKGCNKNDEGAHELNFSNNRTTALINIHYAAARFNKRPGKGRRLQIPIAAYPDPDLGTVLRLDMERARILKGSAEASVGPETTAQAAPTRQTETPGPAAATGPAESAGPVEPVSASAESAKAEGGNA